MTGIKYNSEELLLPMEWEEKLDVKILDPDGWLFTYGDLAPKNYNEIITRKEFEKRMLHSTVQIGFNSALIDDLKEI